MTSGGGVRSNTPRLRGRDAEHASIDRLVQHLAEGSGGVVVLEGAPGSGKTRLLAEAVDGGRRRGCQVLTGAGQVAALGVPAWLLLDVLTDADEPPVDVDALGRAAGLPESGFRLVQELHEGLEKAALRAPVLIVVDDFQWADLATANAVRTLTRRLAADPVLWVIALRPDPPAPVREVADQLAARGEVVRLGPLDAEAVALVARDVLGGVPDRRLGGMLAGAQGRPLLLLDYLHGLRDERAVEVRRGTASLRTDRLPLRFRDAILAQLRNLGPDARLAVEMGSVLGRTFTAEQLAGMLDRRPSALLAPLREALDAELIVAREDVFAFRHDLVREAVDTSLPAPLRRALRTQAIDASLAVGAPASEVAALVLQTAVFGDRAGIDLLRRAAAEIGLRSPTTAAQLSTRAFELDRPDDPGRGVLLTEAVTYLVLADRAADAAELFARHEGLALDPTATARARLLIAEAILPSDSGAAAALCGRALEDEGLPADVRARLYSVMASALGIIGRLDEARRAADAAIAEARDDTGRPSFPAALIEKAVIDFQHCEWAAGLRAVDDAVRRRNEVAGTRALSMPAAWKAMMLDSVGRLDEALRLAEEGALLAQADGQLANARVWAMLRARIHLRAGRLDEARAEAEAIQAMSEELGSNHYLHTAAHVLGVIGVHRGDQAAMATARAVTARMATSTAPVWRGRGQWLRALLDEAGGAPLHDVIGDEDMDAVVAGCVRVVVLAEHAEVATLVRLLLAAGERGRAEAAVARLEEELHRHGGDAVVEAAACHARGLLEQDPELLVRAVALHDDDQRLLLRARVREDAGTVVVRTDHRRGVALLGAALDGWEAAGADRDAARVRGALRGHGVRRQTPNRPQGGWAGLTESETRVARMVARGWTNRRIADELFLSPHTVSSHLRHAFVKLGVRSRVELARLVMTTDPQP